MRTLFVRAFLILFIITAGYYQSRPCSGDGPASSANSMLHPTLLEHAPSMHPFIYSFRDSYFYNKTRTPDKELIADRNIQEWKEYFKNIPEIADVKKVIYG
ncbi:MAG: hypothetical protein AB8G22_05170 [Saprospiraceae bacterium]